MAVSSRYSTRLVERRKHFNLSSFAGPWHTSYRRAEYAGSWQEFPVQRVWTLGAWTICPCFRAGTRSWAKFPFSIQIRGFVRTTPKQELLPKPAKLSDCLTARRIIAITTPTMRLILCRFHCAKTLSWTRNSLHSFGSASQSSPNFSSAIPGLRESRSYTRHQSYCQMSKKISSESFC